jgi:large subunit ribosomal protein L20
MTRVKRGPSKLKRRKNRLAQTKGYRFGRSTKEAQAVEAIHKAGAHAFRHRRDKKRDFKQLWHVKINAAVRPEGLSFSKFWGSLKKAGVTLNKKMLAELAEFHPEAFKKVVAMAK